MYEKLQTYINYALYSTVYDKILLYNFEPLCNISGAFYYTLGNVGPLYRSSLKSIQLLCLCKTLYIKKYGIDAVLQPFMNDLRKLEQVIM
jgi:hypothetical protein